MNPYIRQRIERYNAVRAEIDQAMTRAETEHRDLTDAELQAIRAQGDEATRLAEEVTPYLEEYTRAEKVREASAAVHGLLPNAGFVNVATGASAYRELGGDTQVPALMPSPDQVAEMYRAIQGGDPVQRRWTVDQEAAAEHARALVTTTQTGAVNVGLGGPVLREPRRISTAVSLAVERVQGVEGVAFPVFGAGAADIVAEGGTKPEYSAITAGSATPQMISVWTDYTRQSALSVPAFEARLRSKHAALIAKREDQLLVARLQGTTGVQNVSAATGTPPYSDAILAAAGLVLSSDVAAQPDIILVNPADLPKLYPGATTQGVNGESPQSGLRLDMHGCLVYPTSAVAAGSGIVAALGACARFVVGMQPTVLLDTMSGLKTNKITSLMEEAVSLAVDEPSGVVLVDFDPAA